YTLLVSFAGDDVYDPATIEVEIEIVPIVTTTVLTGPETVSFTEAATFVATVEPADAEGVVEMSADGEAIAGCEALPLVVVDGEATASCTTSDLPVGSQLISADYSGSATHQPSLDGIAVEVVAAPVSLTYT